MSISDRLDSSLSVHQLRSLRAGGESSRPVAGMRHEWRDAKQNVDRFVIESPSSRAVVKSSDDNFGAIEFEYLGPTVEGRTSRVRTDRRGNWA